MASRSLGSLTLDLILKYGGFEQGMDRASRTADKRMREIEARAKKFGTFLGGALAAGAGAATAAIIGLTKNAIDYADHLNDLNQRLGISAEALSGWAYAAKQTGTDIDALGKGLKILAKNMAEALDPKSQQAGLFKALGVEVKDANGNLRDLESVLPEIAGKFKELDNATTEAALSQQLFGKSGVELLEFLNQGQDGLEALRQKARDLGVELNSQTLSAADEFNDKLADLKTLGLAAGVQLAEQLLPTMIQLVDQFQRGVQEGGEVGRIVKWIGDQAQAAVKDLKFMYESLKAFGDVFIGLKEAALGYYELLHAIATLDFSEAAKSLERMRAGGNLVREAATRDVRARSEALPPGLVQEMDFTLGAPLSPQEKSGLERRVNGFLGGSSKKSKSGKSDAEREAEQLKAAYDRMNESLAEQVALFGQDGEAARIRYEIEHGSLQKLTEAQKDGLLAQADKLDMMRAEAELMKEADRRVQDETRAIERRAENQKNILSDMQFELSIMGLTNKERERAIALRYAEADATSEVGKAISDMSDQLYEAQRAQEVWDEFQRSMSDAFVDLASGAKSLKDVIKDFFDSVAAAITRSIAEGWAEQLTAMFRTGGASSGAAASGGASSAGFWANLAGALFGGGRAGGGSVSAGMFYRVNENGPEMLSVSGKDYLMMGNKAGMVTPNRSGFGGANQVTQNVIVQGRPTKETMYQIERATAKGAGRAMRRG